MKFKDAVQECLQNKEFMSEYRRISWSRLWLPESPITTMIDESTGYKDKMYHELFDFVMKYVRLPIVLPLSPLGWQNKRQQIWLGRISE